MPLRKYDVRVKKDKKVGIFVLVNAVGELFKRTDMNENTFVGYSRLAAANKAKQRADIYADGPWEIVELKMVGKHRNLWGLWVDGEEEEVVRPHKPNRRYFSETRLFDK